MEGAPCSDRTTRKFNIILTDGVQTTAGWGPGESRNLSHARNNLVTPCDGMKARGITVFTIAHDVMDPAATSC